VEETIGTISKLAGRNELTEGQYNFISYLLSRKELSRKDVVVITLSLFADGLSTVSFQRLVSQSNFLIFAIVPRQKRAF